MPRLHIFNPDTDYALASDRRYYTPPAHVVELRRHLALLPAIYATPHSDAILVLDDDTQPQSEHLQLVREKGIKVLSLEEARVSAEELSGYVPDPWGWNRSILTLLKDTVGEMTDMPSEKDIDTLRLLSHRRTTLPILQSLADVTSTEIELPMEIKTTEEAMDLYYRDRKIYFKAPWSSSGRGIMLTDDLEEKHVIPWLRGIIRRQGSVMAEKAYSRKLDFATEWMCRQGTVRFLGYSVFQTSRRGKYHGNLTGSQEQLESIIKEAAPEMNAVLLDRLGSALEQHIAPGYNGPLGVDMLVTKSGNINPCVEVNLRKTMGMLQLLEG